MVTECEVIDKFRNGDKYILFVQILEGEYKDHMEYIETDKKGYSIAERHTNIFTEINLKKTF